MALTQTDLDALDAAIVSKELSVTLEGRSVTYRSIDELIKARQHAARVIAESGGARRSFQFRFTTGRGE